MSGTIADYVGGIVADCPGAVADRPSFPVLCCSVRFSLVRVLIRVPSFTLGF